MLSKMVIFPDIMWNSMTFFINFAKCQNFPDTLQNSLTIPWPWEILFLPDIYLTAMNPVDCSLLSDCTKELPDPMMTNLTFDLWSTGPLETQLQQTAE